MLFGNLGGNSYIPWLLLIITLCFTCGESKIWLDIKKFQNTMIMIAAAIQNQGEDTY